MTITNDPRSHSSSPHLLVLLEKEKETKRHREHCVCEHRVFLIYLSFSQRFLPCITSGHRCNRGNLCLLFLVRVWTVLSFQPKKNSAEDILEENTLAVHTNTKKKKKVGGKHTIQHTVLFEEDKVYLQLLSTSPVLGFQHKIRLSLALLNSNSGSAWHQETDRTPLKQTRKKSVALHTQSSLPLCQ